VAFLGLETVIVVSGVQLKRSDRRRSSINSRSGLSLAAVPVFGPPEEALRQLADAVGELLAGPDAVDVRFL